MTARRRSMKHPGAEDGRSRPKDTPPAYPNAKHAVLEVLDYPPDARFPRAVSPRDARHRLTTVG